MRFFIDIYQNWVYVIESFCVVVVTINCTLAVLYFHPRGIFMVIVTFPLLLHFVKASVNVHDESRDTLESWKRLEHKRKYFAKYRRSCRPLRIRFGRFFYADKIFLLTLLSIVLIQTAW